MLDSMERHALTDICELAIQAKNALQRAEHCLDSFSRLRGDKEDAHPRFDDLLKNVNLLATDTGGLIRDLEDYIMDAVGGNEEGFAPDSLDEAKGGAE